MTPGRRRLAALVGILVGIALVVAAVLLWRSGIETSSYPPVELGGTVVSGPYELTRYSGSRLGGATVVALAALLVLAFSVRAALRR
ncbi:hypothetical protein [Williamsia phyllosphaerae]|uniref:Uncharacterized protein n=1 Tax=Williamsia phyllosphaerae TaxID=885042 RepID=A0ABQ1UM62_9NOCA|nr:hypothetical protein [Williamsia phyllosphaerae]GGF22400.1 hypothetical protein GCM10007298_17920 [Williamsia phyllosphaerae]